MNIDHEKRREFVAGLRLARAVIVALRERLSKEGKLETMTAKEVIDFCHAEICHTIQQIKVKL
jgi:hypothetical protein